MHVESDIGNDRVGDRWGQQVHSRCEFTEGTHDDVSKDVLSESGGFDAEQPTGDEDCIAEGDVDVIGDVDLLHPIVDVVADDRDPLEDESDGDENGVKGDSEVCGPSSSDSVKVTVSVHIGDDETENGDEEVVVGSPREEADETVDPVSSR